MKIQENELKILGEYKFLGNEFLRSQENRKQNSYLLCLRKNERGDWRLDRVQTKDATCWEIFKSYFGIGKLAGCTLSFDAIAGYLADRDITQIATDNPAYDTIHAIAGRMLVYHKKNQGLWLKLATQLRSFQVNIVCRWIDFHNFHSQNNDTVQKTANRTLLITPKTKIGHLIEQVNLIENHAWSQPNYSYSLRPTIAAAWGGWTESYYPWLKTFSYSEEASEKNLSGLFFKVVQDYWSSNLSYNPYGYDNGVLYGNNSW